MSSQPLFVIGSDKDHGEDTILAAGKKAGFRVAMLLASEITITLGSKEADILYRGNSIRSSLKKSRIIFRRTRGEQKKMIALAILADHLGIPHTDSTVSIMSNLDKSISMPALTMKHIQNIPTVFLKEDFSFRSRGSFTSAPGRGGRRTPAAIVNGIPSRSGGSITSAPQHLNFPLLAKPAEGRHGEGVELIKNSQALEKFIKRKPHETFLLQSFLTIDEEYRVFVIGKKSLGAIKKIKAKGALVANYAARARFLPTKIPASIEEEAIDICRQQGIDIAGIDIARVGKKFYLLEVNRCPELRAFTKATGVDVAGEIVRYVMKK